MPAIASTFSQIKALFRNKPPTRALGIHAPVRWTGEPLKHDGDDDLMRLHRRKLYSVSSWQIVRSQFQASAVDPRLTRAHMSWLADALLAIAPSNDYPSARGGSLDAEAVWSWLLDQTLGLTAQSPDLTTLLKWSTDADSVIQFRRLAPAVREGAIEWLRDRAGPVAPLILRCLEHLERPDVVAIGLAAGVVFHRSAAGRLEKAAGKFAERFLAGQTADGTVMARWNAAATEVVRSLQYTAPRLHRQIVQRADDILRDVQADNFAYLSDTMLFEEVTRCREEHAHDRGSTTPIEPRPSGSGASAAPPVASWIQSLLVSPIFTEQTRQCGRAMPAAEKLTEFLVALDTRGGKMTAVALAKALQLPAFRLNSFLAVVQRVLNVDGYAVLLRDSASESVELNRELLAEQFALEVGR